MLARLDLLVVLVYLAGMLFVAARVSSGSRDVEGYTLGNRSLPTWAIGLSVLATFLSSITFLATPAQTYKGNWNVLVFAFALPPAAWVATRWFVPLYRRQVGLSAYEFLHQRFGMWARGYAVASYVVLQLIRIATVLLLVSFPLQRLLDWEITPTLLLLGGIVIVYDVLGGMRAVVWTDVVQVVILLFGALWCLATMALRWPTADTTLLATLPVEKMSLGPLYSLDLLATTVAVTFVYGLSENLRNYGTDQNYVQRTLAAATERGAQHSIWIGALAYLPLSAVFCLIGTSLYAFHLADDPGLATADLAQVAERSNYAFADFIRYELPQPVAGLVIAAILAAAMSTVDSSLNSMSTVVLVDVVRPVATRRGWKLPEIQILRGSTVTLGVLGTGTAVALYEIFQGEKARTILDLWWQYAGTAGGGLFGLFLLAWLLPHTPRWGAALAVVATLPVLAWGTLMRQSPTAMPWAFAADSDWAWLNCPLHPNLVGITGTLTLLVVGGLAGLMAGRRGPSDPSI